MIEINDTERDFLSARVCPDCRSPLLPGARGGFARNFYCTERAACRQGFNLTFLYDGALVFAQRIGEVPDGTFTMYCTKRDA